MIVTHSRCRIITAAFLMLLLVSAVIGNAEQKATTPPDKQAEWAAQEKQLDQTAVVAASTISHLNIPYGANALQKLDVYAPSGVNNMPVVVFVHGGEWARHDKASVSFKPKFLNEHGIIFVSINYRLSPPAVHPDHVNDVAAAVAWLRSHIAEYGGSPDKIFLMGHSAGCHLVTLTGLDPRPLARFGLKPKDLRGVIAWSGGAYDLVQRAHDAGMYAPYIRKAFGDKEANWRDGSPVYHVTDTKPLPPFLFISVERNNPSHLASERLASLIREAGGKAESRLIENRNHLTAIHLLGAPDDTTGQILLDFVARNAK